MPPKFKKYLKSEDVRGSHQVERANLLGDYHDDEDGDDDEGDFFMQNSPVPERNRGKQTADPKVQRVQNEVDQVIDIMHDNIGKVLNRGERLEDLQDKSDDLAYNATVFRVSAKGLRSQFWWRDFKMKLIFVVLLVALLLIIFIPIIIKGSSSK